VVVGVHVKVPMTHDRRYHPGDRFTVGRRALVVIAEYHTYTGFFQSINRLLHYYNILYSRYCSLKDDNAYIFYA